MAPVIVPILHDFNAADSMHIINHSDACILFVSDSIFSALDFDAIPEIRAVVSLDTRTVIAERSPVKVFGKRSCRVINPLSPTSQDISENATRRDFLHAT